MSTLFTKIINGEIPSYTIYEDDLVYAFLDICPMKLGHTLLVPKEEIDKIQDLDDTTYSRLFSVAKKLSKSICAATGSLRTGMLVEGLEVPHAHLHLVPISGPGELSFSNSHEEPAEEMQAIQRKIIANL